jgi:hypothetical protein
VILFKTCAFCCATISLSLSRRFLVSGKRRSGVLKLLILFDNSRVQTFKPGAIGFKLTFKGRFDNFLKVVKSAAPLARAAPETERFFWLNFAGWVNYENGLMHKRVLQIRIIHKRCIGHAV